MNTLTAPQRSDRRRSDDTVPLSHLPLQDRTPRTALPDRVALRVALALLLWSTRPQLQTTATARRAQRDRATRELDWQLRCHRLPHL
ncbi:hypothetical protein [Microbacterium sp. T2.11-28]|uniref:hypothetical protein n=1 Tax=unclassified Microbacterium TaxID=2609290 RepID=UPI0024776A07|nr:hypothetical protein [Microbacterium sp. T2.11-28]CAI9386384.1 hypothetical protein MICABA_00359 [Microbacterium sp. T2.11-28]